VPPENVSNRFIANGVAEIGKSTDDPIVAPPGFSLAMRTIRSTASLETGGRPIALRYFDPSNFRATSRRYQARICFRLNDSGDLRKCFPAQPFANFRQSRPLRVGQLRTLRQLRPENPIFGDQVFVLKQQLLVNQARNIRQQTNHFVVDHRERPSSQIKANKRLLVYSPYGVRLMPTCGRRLRTLIRFQRGCWAVQAPDRRTRNF
jgi:hypothetical protein